MEFTKADHSSLWYRIVSHVLFAPLWFTIIFISLGTTFAILYFSEAIPSFPWLVFFIIGMLLVAWTSLTAYLSYINLGYSIEENGLKFREGIFALHTQTIPYSKITNASFEQSFMQRLFGVGNISIDQEDSHTNIDSVDKSNADKIIAAISKHSNIQTIKPQ